MTTKSKELNLICPLCDSDVTENTLRGVFCCDGCGEEFEKWELKKVELNKK